MRTSPWTRAKVFAMAGLAVLAAGQLLDRVPGRGVVGPETRPAQALPEPTPGNWEEAFTHGVAKLHVKEYVEAKAAFEQVLAARPELVEARVNLGYARLGLEEYPAACAAFEQAIDQRVTQANAYYGLAECLQGKGDLAGALGAMRAYVHLSRTAATEDPYRRRAEAAIWELETQLARSRTEEPTDEGGS